MIKLIKSDRDKINKIKRLVKPIFFEPKELLSYDDIILGKRFESGTVVALASNTYRGFHKIDKNKPGAGTIFPEYFINNKLLIIKGLKAVKTVKDLDKLLDTISKGILNKLKKNIDNHQLESYNKVRKPVDIVIEMVVCLAAELNMKDRKRIVPLLRLPLDSWMFKEKLVFADEDLKILAINRRFSFQNVKTKTHYNQLQGYISHRATQLSSELCPIALDLFWSNRYMYKGKNISQLNKRK